MTGNPATTMTSSSSPRPVEPCPFPATSWRARRALLSLTGELRGLFRPVRSA